MDKTCGPSLNTHGCSSSSKRMSCDHINMLDKLLFGWGEGVFFFSLRSFYLFIYFFGRRR